MMLVCGEPGCDYEVDEHAVDSIGRPTATQKLGSHRWSKHGLRADGSQGLPGYKATYAPPAADADDGAEPSPFTPPSPAVTGEVPPSSGRSGVPAGGPSSPGRRGLFALLRRGKEKTPSLSEPARVTKERAPKPTVFRGKRESGAETLSDGWSALGGLFLRANHKPTGRVIAFQSDAAGEMLDDIVKGTTLDRLVLQKVVGARGTLDTLAALFGPPVLTYRMEQAVVAGNQEAFSFFEGLLKSNIKRALPLMIPAMKKVKKRETEAAAALVDMLEVADLDALGLHVENGQPVDEAGNVVDVGDVFVGMLFADWVATVPPPPAPAPEQQEAPA
jgi:hypothetical protein